MKKVGIMGGTFNPIHFGHLFLAENAYEQAGLHKILFMPSMKPPHKTQLSIMSGEHRLNMVKLAIEDNPHFEASAMELERLGMTYTADTLTILTKDNPDTEYYFIVGADSLLMMEHWKEPQTVFNLSTIIVAGRDRFVKEELEQHSKKLQETFGARILLLDMPTIEISSAGIRERLAAKQSVRYYVPKEVIDYIAKNNLYC